MGAHTAARLPINERKTLKIDNRSLLFETVIKIDKLK